MCPDDSLDHRQAKAGAGGLGGKERLAQARQYLRFDATAIITDTQAQGITTIVEVYLQTQVGTAGLNGVFDQIEQRTDQGVAIAQQLAVMTVALPTDRHTLHMGLRGRLQSLQQTSMSRT